MTSRIHGIVIVWSLGAVLLGCTPGPASPITTAPAVAVSLPNGGPAKAENHTTTETRSEQIHVAGHDTVEITGDHPTVQFGGGGGLRRSEAALVTPKEDRTRPGKPRPARRAPVRAIVPEARDDGEDQDLADNEQHVHVNATSNGSERSITNDIKTGSGSTVTVTNTIVGNAVGGIANVVVR